MSRKYIISGGGTGGHIFPALSIADRIRKRDPEADILFVGAKGRMEMEKVPAAGYKIVGLPVEGLNRKSLFRNIIVLARLVLSLFSALRIIYRFRPDAVVGVGGYASGPLLRIAALRKIPFLIQEQNSYAGVTNRLLAKKASKICVAYSNMEKYFPVEKIVLTGNPVREEIFNNAISTKDALDFFGLQPEKPILLILGGSLGARTINNSLWARIDLIENAPIQVLWQTGRLYFDQVAALMKQRPENNIRYFDFIARMDMAYAAADIIISRAGAATISELCLLGKPVILVPSPNVAEDHQTKNAMALVNNEAAIMVTDNDAPEMLVKKALELFNNRPLMSELGANCKKMALHGSAEKIVDELFKLVKND